MRFSELRRIVLLALLVLGLAAVAAGCGGDDEEDGGEEAAPATTAEGGAAEECSATIGLASPNTGDAASIGEEITNWSEFAVDRFNEENGTSFELEVGDTQLDPAVASTLAQRFVSNDEIVAVLGPAASQEVESSGPIYTRANMAMVSMSATRDSLTAGDLPTFYRVVPKDSVQGPTDAQYMIDELDAQKVVVVDDQTSYSTGLADAAETTLEDGGVTVQRESVNQRQTDFSALIARIPDDADVVFTPWQLPARGTVFYNQLAEQGKEVTLFGADGFFNPTDFKGEGSYVSTFAPDIREVAEHKELVDAYRAEHGDFGTFGPPSYEAARVVMTAIKTICDEGGEITRETVEDRIADTELSPSLLGDSLSFDENGDVEGGRFYIYRYENGNFTFVQ
jgi:branched-chain amino acid transport system substrate-binding protein